MPKTVAVLIGLQASGKSTFYKTHLSDRFVHVNLDTLRTRHRERCLIEECHAKGQSYAVDNTDPTRLDRARYIAPAKAEGYRVIGYFMESKLRACVERNAKREGTARVPDQAIAATSNKLELPSLEEGFDELYFVRIDGEGMVVEPWRDE